MINQGSHDLKKSRKKEKKKSHKAMEKEIQNNKCESLGLNIQ